MPAAFRVLAGGVEMGATESGRGGGGGFARIGAQIAEHLVVSPGPGDRWPDRHTPSGIVGRMVVFIY